MPSKELHDAIPSFPASLKMRDKGLESLSLRIIMNKENQKYVECAHCGARIRSDKAIKYNNVLIYGAHYHCRNCDPDGDWDCVSHELDFEMH